MQHRRDVPSRPMAVLGLGLLVAAGCRDGAGTLDPSDDDVAADATGEVEPVDPSFPEAETEFCEGPVRVRYDLDPRAIDAFPDDLLTEDASTPTGIRLLDLEPKAPFDRFQGLFEGLATLDGFGAAASLFVRIDGPLDPATLPPSGVEDDPSRSSLLLLDVEASSFVEFEWRIVDEREGGTTLLVDPLRPLRPAARHALVLTRKLRDPDGACIAPSETMRALLEGRADPPAASRLASRYETAIERLRATGVVDGPEDLSAAIVFTTQTTIDENVAIARVIEEAAPPAVQPGSCAPYGGCTRCDLGLAMTDFRDETGTVPRQGGSGQTHVIPVVAFVPASGPGPFPTLVYAHGLDGDRNHAAWEAAQACEDGHAVVAIDAPKHGDHPDVPLLLPALDLMGLTGDPDDPFVVLRARDALRQATFDTLQLLRRIEAGMDVDGDGAGDLDPDHVHYLGVSLGAVLAPPVLAFAPQVRSATLVVGGARLTDIVSEDSELGALTTLVTSGMHAAQRQRFLAMAQAGLDRGEPEVFARHVLVERVEGFHTGHPQVLAQMVVDDTIVPNSSTAYMLRSLGVPIVGEPWTEPRAVGLEPMLPLRSNLGPGQTAGLFQIKHVGSPGGQTALEPATHLNVQHDAYAYAQRRAFLLSSLDPEGALITDPFAAD